MNDYQKYKLFRNLAIISGIIAVILWIIYFITNTTNTDVISSATLSLYGNLKADNKATFIPDQWVTMNRGIFLFNTASIKQ